MASPTYKVVSVRIASELPPGPERTVRIEGSVQPVLDLWSQQGWRLHSFSAAAWAEGHDLVLIWERAGPYSELSDLR